MSTSEAISCELCSELLDDYRQNSLPPLQSDRVADHLKSCDLCAQELKSAVALGQLLRRTGPQVSATGSALDLAAISKSAVSKIIGTGAAYPAKIDDTLLHAARHRMLPRTWYYLAAAACLIFIAYISKIQQHETRAEKSQISTAAERRLDNRITPSESDIRIADTPAVVDQLDAAKKESPEKQEAVEPLAAQPGRQHAQAKYSVSAAVPASLTPADMQNNSASTFKNDTTADVSSHIGSAVANAPGEDMISGLINEQLGGAKTMDSRTAEIESKDSEVERSTRDISTDGVIEVPSQASHFKRETVTLQETGNEAGNLNFTPEAKQKTLAAAAPQKQMANLGKVAMPATTSSPSQEGSESPVGDKLNRGHEQAAAGVRVENVPTLTKTMSGEQQEPVLFDKQSATRISGSPPTQSSRERIEAPPRAALASPDLATPTPLPASNMYFEAEELRLKQDYHAAAQKYRIVAATQSGSVAANAQLKLAEMLFDNLKRYSEAVIEYRKCLTEAYRNYYDENTLAAIRARLQTADNMTTVTIR